MAEGLSANQPWIGSPSSLDLDTLETLPARSFEPYVPLRKASPHKLQTRKVGPHPLLYTGSRGYEPFIPSTSPIDASPNYTTAIADNPRQSSLAGQSRKASVDTVVSPSSEYSVYGWTGFGKQDSRQDLHEDAQKENIGVTTLRATKSVSEGMRGLKERLAGLQHQPLLHNPSLDEQKEEEEKDPDTQERTSGISGITTASSYVDSFASTERNSQTTAMTAITDVTSARPTSRLHREDSFSVEDAIGMYANGFGTPSRGSMASQIAKSPERRLATSPERRPGTSPSPAQRPAHLHRRSHSAIFTDASRLSQDKAFSPTDLKCVTITEGLYIPSRAAPPRPVRPTAPPNSTVGPVERDRYGFKKVSHHVTLADFNAWETEYSQHLDRRRAKWEAMMKQFGLATENPTRFPPHSERIKRYVRKGIPPEWRGAAWFWYAGGPGLLKRHEGLYFALLQTVKRGELREIDKEHIERDLLRTFPDNITFKPDSGRSASTGSISTSSDTPIIAALRRVLQAFAVHRPSIGYCQSLNFIAGMLLLFLNSDEEKSFLLLNVITTDYIPGTHGASLQGATVDTAVLMASIKELLPAIWAKLDDKPTNNPTPVSPTQQQRQQQTPSMPTVSLATTPWFLTLYLTTLPVETSLRIWDCLFLEGSKTLFRAALAVFKTCEAEIRDAADAMEVFQIVQARPKAMLDANALMELCFRRKRGAGFGGLSQDTIERRRDEVRTSMGQGGSGWYDEPDDVGVGGKKVLKGGDGLGQEGGKGRVDGELQREKSVIDGFRGRFRSRTAKGV